MSLRRVSSVSDLAQVARDAVPAVLREFLGLAATEAAGADAATARSSDVELCATVPLAGPEASGHVCLRLARGFALLALRQLHGGSPSGSFEEHEVRDFAGELCNLLAGRVAAELARVGEVCKLGVPEVVIGADTLVAGRPAGGTTPSDPSPASALRSCTIWSCAGHRLTLDLRQYRRLT